MRVNVVKIIFIVFSLLAIVMSSCEKKRIEKERYPNGTLRKITKYSKINEILYEEHYDSLGFTHKKIYFKLGKIDSILVYKNGKKYYKKEFTPVGIIYTNFYKNGKVESKGSVVRDTLKIGWWLYYDSEGKIKSKREYIKLCADYYLNQSIIFDKNSDTIFREDDFNESIFYKFNVKPVSNDNVEFIYKISPISYRSNLELVLLKTDDFCNEDKNIDTIIPLKDNSGSLIFNKGRKHYIGFIFDYYIDTVKVNKNKQKLNAVSRKMYFRKKIGKSFSIMQSPQLL